MQPTDRTCSNIGPSVPDLYAAVKFHTDVLGLYTITERTDVTQGDSDIGSMCSDVFGPGWKHLRIARLSNAEWIGLELFHFDGNYAPQNNMSFRQNGTFHFAIQDSDLEGLLARTLAAGGKQRMPVREYYPGKKPYRMVYVKDPYGIVFEIHSHSYELTYPVGAYA